MTCGDLLNSSFLIIDSMARVITVTAKPTTRQSITVSAPIVWGTGASVDVEIREKLVEKERYQPAKRARASAD